MKTLKTAFMLSIVLLLICGVIYPLALTGVGQIAFNDQANGSIIEVNGVKIGSANIGQEFTDPRFFKGRISSVNYNTYEKGDTTFGGVSSGSFNYAASNPDLILRVEESIKLFLEQNPDIKKEDIPADLLTASGSGLDPDISVQSAKIQIPAISKATDITQEELNKIVDDNISEKILGVFGEERVNVLRINIEIAKILGIL